MHDQDAQQPAPDRQRGIAAVALLDDPTRRRLYDLVVTHGSLGRDAAAAAAGISRDLAAFHLDRLVEGDLLQATYRRLSGRSGPGAGRPAKVYSRSAHEFSISLPERQYAAAAEVFADSLEGLASAVGQQVVAESVNQVARRRGQAVGRSLRQRVGDTAQRLTRARRRERLIDELTRRGFGPALAPDSRTVVLRNCPYQTLSEGHRNLTCGMNLAWAGGLVEATGDVGLRPRLAPEPGRCCVIFEPTR